MRKIDEEWPYKTKKLFELIESQTGGNVSEFAKRICVDQQRINRLFLRDKRSGDFPRMSNELEVVIRETFDLPNKFFILPPVTEDINPMEELFKSDNNIKNRLFNKNKTTKSVNDSSQRPRIEISAIAGKPVEYTDDCCEMQPIIPQIPYYDFTIKVNGDSMMPEYKSGDEVACRRIEKGEFMQWGQVFVINSSQGAFIKRLYKGTYGYLCVSDNQKYPEFEISEEEVYSISLVVGLLRIY